ncbi:MAG: hypothetical protein A2855_00150 [Candidatus Liptonbacteria bacterium RIFCSPHIGHO2_01_FULL_57_28]|uniref:Four helix bundle protein n=1 Tax=Candidatus Liptonbacteria bacterium RIFCSPHIGHO2_01_FULL_57_28 TaxID=1798647 RepID=A0A1G2CB95_9BACT|nr:MAG: hypothetical protein A2855_00150 [Candidatus Liptonbacteria bacterium RIFCSPHIGHO2_01_FULL_57_28]
MLLAGYSAKTEKASAVAKASTKLDALKFFLQIMNQCKELTDPKYVEISKPLERIGKMLGGWQKQILGTGSR